MKKYKELLKDELSKYNGKKPTFSHTASRRGYVSRKQDGVVIPYIGRFGVGFAILRPRYDTTQYCYIDYYTI